MNNSHSHSYKKHYLAFLFYLLCCLGFCVIHGEGITAIKFFSPLNDSNRTSFSSIQNRLISLYGEYRKSYKPGHLHAGVDLKGSYNETVFAIGTGHVYHIFREFPHKSVIVEHSLQDDAVLYSVYTHVEDIEVDVGDWVDERTPLARLFSEDELERANFGTPNHLHLEIRISIADEGRASYASMTRQELNKFCMDPIKFFKSNLEK